MSREFKPLLERETQLNLFAYFTILALAAVCGVLIFMLVARIPMPSYWVLGDTWVRSIGLAFILAIVVYLADQQRRLQLKLRGSYAELAEARTEIASAYERLAFAHHAAELMAATPGEAGLCELLSDVANHFGADASAVVGTDVTIHTCSEDVRVEARGAIMQAALETVRAGTPLSITHAEDGSSALAVPLRVEGHLHSVLCVWKQSGELESHMLEGLQLVARILELSMENRTLLEQTGGQLGSMVHAMLDLLDRRRPDYTEHAEMVSRVADSIARKMGMGDIDRHSLRVAALLHDVGILEVPEALLRTSGDLNQSERHVIESHPRFGADLARVAGLDQGIQDAILFHHERLDGSGFPTAASGDGIPLSARILAVADDFAGMTTSRMGQPALPESQALHILHLGAGMQYDQRVVTALDQVATGAHGSISAPLSFNPESLFEHVN